MGKIIAALALVALVVAILIGAVVPLIEQTKETGKRFSTSDKKYAN